MYIIQTAIPVAFFLHTPQFCIPIKAMQLLITRKGTK